MKKFAALVAVAAAVVPLLPGSSPKPKVVRCSPADFAAQCVQPAPSGGVTVAPALVHGIDFAWSCPSPVGQDFGASYLSPDGTKNWSRPCLARWHGAGAKTVFVYESSATRALGGYAAGRADAQQAVSQLASLGAQGAHVDFAIDFDEAPGQAAAVASYFQGADSVLGAARVGAYGSYWAVTRLCAAGLVTRSWQTYAWSGGLWAPAACAPLEQYLNTASVDFDRAVAPDYGQVPAYVPPKPPTPKPVKPICFGAHPLITPGCRFVQREVAAWKTQAAGDLANATRVTKRWS